MTAARMLTMLAASAAMSACAAQTSSHELLKPQQTHWATYQHSSDRNAVFENYAINHDWSFNTKSKINSGLALVGNTLLFTTFTHKLVAIDVRNGNQLWQADVGNIAMSTPIVAGNLVFVGTGKSGLLHRNLLVKLEHPHQQIWGVPGGDEIAAYDLRTGAKRWSYHTVGEDMPSPVYDRGRLIFANGDSHAYALNAESGDLIWSTNIGGISTMSSAVTAGNVVVVGVCSDGMRDSTSVALDSSTGKILWRSQYGHCDAAPAYADGKVFVSDLVPGDTYLQGRPIVAALDPKSGKPFWVYQGATQGIWSIVASDEAAVAGTYANGTYYQAEPFTDEVLAFDAQNGRLRWTFHTSGPAKMSPVVKNGRVHIGDTAGLLYTINAQDGRLLEMREFKEPFSVSPPIIAGNKLLVVNGTSVHAVPLTGRPQLAEPVGWAIAASPPKKKTQ